MTKKLFLPSIVLLFLLAACGGGGGTTDAVVEPPPVEEPPPVVSQPTVKTSYYRLHVEIVSSSDWATLTPQNPAVIRAVRQLSLTGPIARSGALAERLWVVASTGLASVTTPQTLVADIAVDKTAVANGVQFRLEKGVLNDVTVRIYAYSDDTHYSLIQEIVHSGVVAGQTATNPLTITVSPAAIAAAPLLTAEAPKLDKKALAFYYPWYRPADWDLPEFIDEPVERYSTLLPADVGKVVDKAINAGLTGFVTSWWGPSDTSNPRFQTLLDVIQNRNFETSIYYETLRGGVPLDNETIISELTYALKTYGSNPKFMHWDGKPVIFVWATGRISNDNWKLILAAVRASAGPALFIGMGCDTADMDVFDGLHDYTVNSPVDLPQYEKRCGQKTSNHFLLNSGHKRKIWVATAMPGYDDTAIANRTEHLVIPRNNGDYYRHTLNAALASNPDWLIITSWNEWPENTQIEASLLHGTLYEDITRSYVSPWLAQ